MEEGENNYGVWIDKIFIWRVWRRGWVRVLIKEELICFNEDV